MRAHINLLFEHRPVTWTNLALLVAILYLNYIFMLSAVKTQDQVHESSIGSGPQEHVLSNKQNSFIHIMYTCMYTHDIMYICGSPL